MCSADLKRDDLTGLSLAQYALGKRIGQGGMGQVFLAVHQHLGKTVAIKFIRHDVAGQEAQERFLQEIQAVGRLSHPNLIHANDAGKVDHVLYCVTEYMEGYDLLEWIRQKGAMPPAAAAEVIRQAALGLQHAHSEGFVHRDIKPNNLFLERNGNVRLLDFGLAFQAKLHGELTSHGQLLGTIDFISPEQARDAHAATPQSDLYSLGATLVYLLSGQPPFPDAQYPSIPNKLTALMTSLPTFVAAAQDLPVEVREVLEKSLSLNPGKRFNSAREVAAHLQPIAAPQELASWMVQGAIPNKVQKPPWDTIAKSAVRNWRTIAATAAAITLLSSWYTGQLRKRNESSIVVVTPTAATSLEAPPLPFEPIVERMQTRRAEVAEFMERRGKLPLPSRTIVHQPGASGNARAIGVPGRSMSESISNKKGNP